MSLASELDDAVKNYPVVTLDEALYGLNCPDAALHIVAAKKDATQVLQNNPNLTLSLDEAASVCIYIQEWMLYKTVNYLMRTAQTDALRPWTPYLALIRSALSKLSVVRDQTIYRGVRQDTAVHIAGMRLHWNVLAVRSV